jgi:hypothetical protein
MGGVLEGVNRAAFGGKVKGGSLQREDVLGQKFLAGYEARIFLKSTVSLLHGICGFLKKIFWRSSSKGTEIKEPRSSQRPKHSLARRRKDRQDWKHPYENKGTGLEHLLDHG